MVSLELRPFRRGPHWAIYVAALAATVLLLSPLLALGLTSPAPDEQPAAGEHTLRVVGTGRTFVQPDEADVQLGIQLMRDRLRVARDDAARIMGDVLDALRRAGIAERDIQTSILSISPVYGHDEPLGQRISGYQVTNIVQVRVRDLEQLAVVIDDSVAAGATTVQGVTFQLSDPGAAEQQAREAAVRDARGRAETLAAAAGVRITGVATIEETFSTPWTPDRSDWGGLAAPTPILGGTAEVSVTVSIAFLIE